MGLKTLPREGWLTCPDGQRRPPAGPQPGLQFSAPPLRGLAASPLWGISVPRGSFEKAGVPRDRASGPVMCGRDAKVSHGASPTQGSLRAESADVHVCPRARGSGRVQACVLASTENPPRGLDLREKNLRGSEGEIK